ncbi:unnamed protein product, partial [Ceratitis capitata]
YLRLRYFALHKQEAQQQQQPRRTSIAAAQANELLPWPGKIEKQLSSNSSSQQKCRRLFTKFTSKHSSHPNKQRHCASHQPPAASRQSRMDELGA